MQIKPINDYLIVEYQLSKNDVDTLYPLTPEGKLNMDEQEFQRYPKFDKNQTFEEALSDPQFFLILMERIGQARSGMKSTIIALSEDLNSKFGYLKSSKVLMGNALGIQNMMGLKYEITDPIKGAIRALVTPKDIMAIIKSDGSLKPIHNFVELEFNFPEEMMSQVLTGGFKIIPHEQVDASKRNEKELDENFFRSLLAGMTISQNEPIVTAVYDESKAKVKVGDTVQIINDYSYMLGQAARFDFVKNKIYFIKPETTILGVIENL